MPAPVSISVSEDQARAAFTLFHPKGNIVTYDMVVALRQALDAVVENPHLKLITITGAGADFSFGASIPEHAPDRIGQVLPEMHALVSDLLAAPAATAAIVRGRCLGGGFELALACDFICASDTAVFGLPEVALGVFPPAASALLPLRVGSARATDAIVGGEPCSAAEWQKAGLIALAAPEGALDAAVERWFDRRFAPRSAAALRHACAAARLPIVTAVEHLLPRLEQLYLQDLMGTADASEGIAAFMDRRPPRWSDR